MSRLQSLAAISLALAGCASGPSEPRPNLTLLKWQCVQWHDSGAYAHAVAKAAEPAGHALEGYLHGTTPQNFAIVFDIDETLLSNWPYLAGSQFAIQPATFAAWTQREKAIPLAPVQQIYQRALAYQIPIFLITGRDESLRDATRRDLQEAGYWGWRGLFMRPPGYADSSIVPFKSGVRKALYDQGFRIILNIGDQNSDLAGGYADNRIKLPNPFYFIP